MTAMCMISLCWLEVSLLFGYSFNSCALCWKTLDCSGGWSLWNTWNNKSCMNTLRWWWSSLTSAVHIHRCCWVPNQQHLLSVLLEPERIAVLCVLSRSANFEMGNGLRGCSDLYKILILALNELQIITQIIG